MSELRTSDETPWAFACNWYSPDDIHRSINANKIAGPGHIGHIPGDVYSREFAEWLTDQYRLAMNKGMEIMRGWCEKETAIVDVLLQSEHARLLARVERVKEMLSKWQAADKDDWLTEQLDEAHHTIGTLECVLDIMAGKDEPKGTI